MHVWIAISILMVVSQIVYLYHSKTNKNMFSVKIKNKNKIEMGKLTWK